MEPAQPRISDKGRGSRIQISKKLYAKLISFKGDKSMTTIKAVKVVFVGTTGRGWGTFVMNF